MAPPPITPSPRRFLPSKSGRHPSSTFQALPPSASQQFAPTPRFGSAKTTSKAKDLISDDQQLRSASSPLVPRNRLRSTPRRASREDIDDDNDDVLHKETNEGKEQNGTAFRPSGLTTTSKALQDAMQIDPPANEDQSSELEDFMLPPPPKRRRLTPSPPPQQPNAKASLSDNAAHGSLAALPPPTHTTPPRHRPIMISSSPRSPQSSPPSPSPSHHNRSPMTPHANLRSHQPTTASRFRLSPPSSKVPNQQRSAFILPPSESDHTSVYDPSFAALLFSPHRSRRGRPPRGGTAGRKYEYMPGGMAATVRDWVVGMSHVPGAGRERIAKKLVARNVGLPERGGRPIRGALMSEGREDEETGREENWLLIGDLAETDGGVTKGKREAESKLEERAVVAAREPSWEVEMNGEAWSVVMRWEVIGRRS